MTQQHFRARSATLVKRVTAREGGPNVEPALIGDLALSMTSDDHTPIGQLYLTGPRTGNLYKADPEGFAAAVVRVLPAWTADFATLPDIKDPAARELRESLLEDLRGAVRGVDCDVSVLHAQTPTVEIARRLVELLVASMNYLCITEVVGDAYLFGTVTSPQRGAEYYWSPIYTRERCSGNHPVPQPGHINAAVAAGLTGRHVA